MSAPITTLKKRAEFLRVRGGGRATARAFVLEGKRRDGANSPLSAGPQQCDGPRFGFTITKKLGNAVLRNRIRRRLRAAVTEVAATTADPTADYVLVAREAAATQTFADLVADLGRALAKVGVALHTNTKAARSKPRGPA